MSFLFRKADSSSAVPSSTLGSEMDSQDIQIRTPEEAGMFTYIHLLSCGGVIAASGMLSRNTNHSTHDGQIQRAIEECSRSANMKMHSQSRESLIWQAMSLFQCNPRKTGTLLSPHI
jgi:hypothetical protein